jgi:hypothetical protein
MRHGAELELNTPSDQTEQLGIKSTRHETSHSGYRYSYIINLAGERGPPTAQRNGQRARHDGGGP